MTEAVSSVWMQLRHQLVRSFPGFYELEPNGPLAMDLGKMVGSWKSDQKAKLCASMESQWKMSWR